MVQPYDLVDDGRKRLPVLTLLCEDLSAGRWLERTGDASFYLGDFLGALQDYEESLKTIGDPDPVYLKLSDVHFELGNLNEERRFREKIYGRLDAR